MPTPRPDRSPDLIDGREAWHEDKVVDAIVAERLVRTDQSFRSCLLKHFLFVDPGAVVDDLNDDVAAFVERVQFQCAYLGFASGDAFLRHFQTVIQRVANQMNQRVTDFLEDGLVKLGTLTVELQVDLLAERVAGIPHQAREATEGETDRQHADRHDAFLQLTRIAR